jgi:hypothetical protein
LAPAPGSHPRQGSVQWLKWRESQFLLLLQPIIDWNQTGLLSQIGDRVENQSNILQVPTNSTQAHPSILSRAVEQRTSLSAIPSASPKPLKQAPGIKSNSETVMPKAATKSQVFSRSVHSQA